MSYYRRLGDVPAKRHTVHRGADGERLLEELMGTAGFAGASSLLYHRSSPSALLEVDAVDDGRAPLEAAHPLVPVHLRTRDLPASASTDLVGARQVLAGNRDVLITVATASDTSPLYRNAFGDELVFVHEGRGSLDSVFGPIAVGAGDYVVVPSGTTHRWTVDEPLRALVLETSGHVAPPARYLTDGGQFREHAPYCERDLRGPTAVIEQPELAPDWPVEVLVRTRQGLTRHTYANHPFDVVGWDGCVWPYALSIHDFEPIVGSLHQPPPVHQTFEGPGMVVCSFVPRPFDFHPDAVKVPYHHANVDSDEVLFYVDGDFMSRAGTGIGAGSLTVHPAGFIHGPQPGSWEASIDQTGTNETAVMIDTFAPLLRGSVAPSISDPDYATSWTG